MATINGVYHPTDSDPYKLTGTGSGSGDLGSLALTAGQKAEDAAAAAATAAIAEAVDQANDYTDMWRSAPTLTDTNLDTFTSANFGNTGTWRASASSGVTGYPPELDGGGAIFRQHRFSTTSGIQWWTTAGGWVYQRVQTGGTWSPWERIDAEALKEYADNSQNIPTLYDTDLDTFTANFAGTGRWRASAATGVTNYPPQLDGGGALFRQHRFSSTTGIQWWTTATGAEFKRVQSGTWSPWVRIDNQGGGGGGVGDGRGANARTAAETVGEWTTHAQEDAYLEALSEHQAVTRIEVGRSVLNAPIYGVQLGNPDKPAVLIMCTQHGDELGPREGALQFARELIADAQSMALYDMCVVIVPTVNPDQLDLTRNNNNGVNINRDWEAGDRTQPETQALVNLFGQYNFVAAVDAHSFGYVRWVSLRETRSTAASTETIAASQLLYDESFAAFEAADVDVRMYGEPGDPTTPGTFNNEVSGVDKIAPMLLEIPYHRYGPGGRYSPVISWQANMACLAFRTVVHTVWRNLPQFEAAKAA